MYDDLKYTDDNYESWCVLGPCQDETPSNADRVRSMSDEELAEWIVNDLIEPGYRSADVEYADWLDWLRQEAQT